MLISHHFHDCKAQLARASRVKWRYTKYLALTFFNLYACRTATARSISGDGICKRKTVATDYSGQTLDREAPSVADDLRLSVCSQSATQRSIDQAEVVSHPRTNTTHMLLLPRLRPATNDQTTGYHFNFTSAMMHLRSETHYQLAFKTAADKIWIKI